MMKQNLISADFPAEKAQEIINKIEGIKSELPFLVTLNPEEKNELVKLGNHFRSFVEKAKQVLDSNPEVMPQVFNNNEFYRDYNLLNNLTPILNELNQLREAIEDTIFVTSSDLLSASLDIYANVQLNKDKIPGMDTIYQEMKEFFKRTKRKNQQQKNEQ